MEVTRKTIEETFTRTKFDDIPANWYIPASEFYSITATLLYHWNHGNKLKDGQKSADKILYDAWVWIEEHTFAYGKENLDEDQSSN